MPEPETAEPTYWSLSEVASRCGISIGLATQATKEAFVTPTVKGKYNPAAAILGICKFLAKRAATLPVYDSMAQCASATGIPLAVIKRVRRTARQAFRNTRIELGPLLKAIFATREEVDYQALETKCKALLAQIELERAQGLKLDKG